MTPEQKHLDKLTRNYGKRKKLTYSDLLLLLREDESVRSLIRETASSAPPHITDAFESAERPPTHPPDPLREQLTSELALLQAVQNDAELQKVWLAEESETEGRQLVRLLATVSQWDQIEWLWKRLADRCRHETRPATAAEKAILEQAVTIHNLSNRDKLAALESVAVGSPYNHEKHQRVGSPTGEVVEAEYLPSLVNAGGKRIFSSLVVTAN